EQSGACSGPTVCQNRPLRFPERSRHGLDLILAEPGVGDRDRAVAEAELCRRSGNRCARHLIFRLAFGTIVHDQRKAASGCFLDVVESNLRAGPERRRDLTEIAHAACSRSASLSRRFRLIIFRTSTPTENPMAA